jgi:hypothetical protein
MSPLNTSMNRSDSDMSDYMPLPLAVRKQSPVVSQAPRKRMQQSERSLTHLEALAVHIRTLQEQNDDLEQRNDDLEKQLAYQIKIDSTTRTLFEDVRSALEMLQFAVQKFDDLREIDQEFIQASNF